MLGFVGLRCCVRSLSLGAGLRATYFVLFLQFVNGKFLKNRISDER